MDRCAVRHRRPSSHLAYGAVSRRYYSVETDVAIVDLAFLGGLTVILMRADRFWPIPMFAAHGVTVLVHVVKLFDRSIVRHAYAISIAAPAYLTLIILLVAVIRHQRRLREHGTDRDWSYPRESA